MGRLADAEAPCRRALEIWRRALGDGHPEAAQNLNTLGSILEAQGRLALAEPLYRENLIHAIPPPHPDQPAGLSTPPGTWPACAGSRSRSSTTSDTWRRCASARRLVQATMVSGLVTALTAIQALGQPWQEGDLLDIRLPLIAVLTALAVAIQPVIVY